MLGPPQAHKTFGPLLAICQAASIPGGVPIISFRLRRQGFRKRLDCADLARNNFVRLVARGLRPLPASQAGSKQPPDGLAGNHHRAALRH